MNKVIHVFVSPADLRRSVRLWRRRLGLLDWTIRAEVVRAETQDRKNVLGNCEFSLPDRVAYITILDARDYDLSGCAPNYDAEETLVHEILHIVAGRIPDNLETEVVIQRAARALVKGYRR
jgi:hypothetical protein